jgi:hypothetical protein
MAGCGCSSLFADSRRRSNNVHSRRYQCRCPASRPEFRPHATVRGARVAGERRRQGVVGVGVCPSPVVLVLPTARTAAAAARRRPSSSLSSLRSISSQSRRLFCPCLSRRRRQRRRASPLDPRTLWNNLEGMCGCISLLDSVGAPAARPFTLPLMVLCCMLLWSYEYDGPQSHVPHTVVVTLDGTTAKQTRTLLLCIIGSNQYINIISFFRVYIIDL